MIQINQKSVKFETSFSYAILLGPVLSQYASPIPGVSLGEIILLFAVGKVCLFNRGYRVNYRKVKPILIFWFFGTIFSLFSFLVQQQLSLIVITRMIRFLFYIVIIVISSNNTNKGALVNSYRKICIFISIYIILQYIVFQISSILLPFKILPLPWMDGRIYGVQEAIDWANTFYLRPSGIFLEPSWAAQYLLPGLAFSLYNWSIIESNKINLALSTLILIAILLTNSSTGIIIALIIVGMYILKVIINNKNYVCIIRNFIIFIVASALLIFFTNLDIYERTTRYVIGNVSGGGSTAMRVFRGFAVFLELPVFYKVIGVGHGNLGEFVLTNNIVTRYDPESISLMAAGYANAISLSLLYYGLGGFCLYINLFKDLWFKTKAQFKLIVIITILVSAVSMIFFDMTMLFYLNLIYVGYEIDKR